MTSYADRGPNYAEAERRVAECEAARASSLALSELGLDELPPSLKQLTWLIDIDVSHNAVGEAGAILLSGLQQLRSARLTWCQIGDAGAAALSKLSGLTSLDLSHNQIGDAGAGALSRLSGLTELNLAGYWFEKGSISDAGAAALSRLSGLTSLDLSGNQIGAAGAAALSRLTGLTSLDLSHNQIGDAGAGALSKLSGLTSLDLSHNQIGAAGAGALSKLSGLTSLDLSGNDIGAAGAAALSKLSGLTSLDLSGNDIGAAGAAALSKLSGLTSLTLSGNDIGDAGAAALSRLTGLTELHLSGNEFHLAGPSSLASAPGLRELHVSRSTFDDAEPEFWSKPSLTSASLHETRLGDVPKEVLSNDAYDDCLPRLRAHFADAEAGVVDVPEVKLMLLGNGRIGKTQIARRLRSEDFKPDEPSTHGVRINEATLPAAGGNALQLKIWDFGGQDIYHGTHALFMKTRAIFVIVWTPGSEDGVQVHDGLEHANQPLSYWLSYVRHQAGPDAPVLIVQAQCDEVGSEEVGLPPSVSQEQLKAFKFRRVLHHSSATDNGHNELVAGILAAAKHVHDTKGVARIAKSRAAVARRLEEMRQEDVDLPSDKRKHRWITKAQFDAICAKQKIKSEPRFVLDYLHNTGAVFYRAGAFGDRIVLDQQWALDAIYAVLDRAKDGPYRTLLARGGCFTRAELGLLVWNAAGFSPREQQMFIDMMQSCGMCFVHRPGYEKEGAEHDGADTEYIATDLLPPREDPRVRVMIEREWGGSVVADVEAALPYAFLSPGVMRGAIARVGEQAGLAADYWREGFMLYEATTASHAIVEQVMGKDGAGKIVIKTRGGRAAELWQSLAELIDKGHDKVGARAGARPDGEAMSVPRRRSTALAKASDADLATLPPEALDPALAKKPLDFRPGPITGPEYYVSYAWGDDTPEGKVRDKAVNDFCDEAERRGIKVRRDTDTLMYGDSLSKFMKELSRGRRVYMFLSDKYLHSINCMNELHQLWQDCRYDDDEFMKRTRVFTLPCAKIWQPEGRLAYALHWKKRVDGLNAMLDGVKPSEHTELLGGADGRIEFDAMTRYAGSVAKVLLTAKDRLQPRDFEEFVKNGLDDVFPEPV